MTVNNVIFILSVPPRPDLMDIVGSPLNDGFFRGLDVTFTCSIALDRAVNTPVTVQGTWNRNGTDLVNDGSRITVMSSPMTMPPFSTTVRINPLRISDTGMYTCSATITPQNATFITGTATTVSRNISIGGSQILMHYNT